MVTDPAATATAVVGMARDGRFAEIEGLFAAPLRALVSAEALAAAWSAGVGAVFGVGEPVCEPAGAGLVRVSVPVTGERGELRVVLSVDGAGLLNGLRLAPAETVEWAPPPYADLEAFKEHEVTVGEGPAAVPGTLTLPRGGGPRPGVVLLAGGGPFDRDATSGANKPLKDLAWGLATRGVAVLRYDKATYVHTMPDGFTMADEYVPHTVAAVHLLQRRRDVTRVFVLGHSMGGKAAPRVAAAEPAVAGLVVLAGDAQPMPQAAVRVAHHIAALRPGSEAAVEAIARQAANVDSPGLSPATPPKDLLFGFSGSYWLDMRSYDPVATAAGVDRPMLFLQGARDYQVTVEDDLARWRAGLSHRPDVTFRVYDAANHLFFPGEGPSGPAEYEPPQHVDPAVVADVAGWLKRHL